MLYEERPMKDYYPAPRVWTAQRPMPDIRTVAGLLSSHYTETLAEKRIARHDGPNCNWTLAAWDERSDWFGAVVYAFGSAQWAFIGNATGVVMAWTVPVGLNWPWEMFESMKRLMTTEIFAAARREGTDAPYWIAKASDQ